MIIRHCSLMKTLQVLFEEIASQAADLEFAKFQPKAEDGRLAGAMNSELFTYKAAKALSTLKMWQQP